MQTTWRTLWVQHVCLRKWTCDLGDTADQGEDSSPSGHSFRRQTDKSFHPVAATKAAKKLKAVWGHVEASQSFWVSGWHRHPPSTPVTGGGNLEPLFAGRGRHQTGTESLAYCKVHSHPRSCLLENLWWCPAQVVAVSDSGGFVLTKISWRVLLPWLPGPRRGSLLTGGAFCAFGDNRNGVYSCFYFLGIFDVKKFVTKSKQPEAREDSIANI